MPERKPSRPKKVITVEQANQMLPLVRAIVRDIVELAGELQQRQERLARIKPGKKGMLGEAHQEEYQQIQGELAKDAARMEEYLDELRKLGVELKGWDGIVDFPGWMDGREVCLCWKLGEAEVSHWHEVDAGFAGRQKLLADVTAGEDMNIGSQER
jgi:hypothetical protein